MNFFTRFSLAAFALALAGCVSADLSQLNSRYDTLSNKEIEISKLDKDGKAYAQAKDELSHSYSALAESAYEVTKETGQKPATKVAIYRLAAISAWKGKNKAIYDKAQPEGEKACDQLPIGTAGAPRDCAFLKYMETLKTYDELVDAYNERVDPITNTALTDAKRIEKLLALLPRLDSLRQSQETLLGKINTRSEHFSGLSPSSQAFFRKLAFASACLAKLYYTVGNTTTPKTPDVIKLSNDGKQVAGRYGQLLVDAGELPGPADPTWYSTSPIVCSGTPQ